MLGFQALWYVLGVVAVIIIMQIKSKWLWKLTPYIYGAGLAVMLALLKFYNRTMAASTGSKTGLVLVLYLAAFRIDEDRLYHDVGVSRHAAQCQASGTDLKTDGLLIAKC